MVAITTFKSVQEIVAEINQLSYAELNARIEAITERQAPPEHVKIIKLRLPELMVAARARHGEIIPCSGHKDWLQCVAVYEDFNKVMLNYNDDKGNTFAITLPINPAA